MNPQPYWGTPSRSRSSNNSSRSSSSNRNCNEECETPSYPPDIYDITPYVVDSNGGAPYTTLDCALRAAYNDPTGLTPTIILRPGTYQLTEALKSSVAVNIVASNFLTDQTPVIWGCGTSGGNKHWSYVKFADSNGKYTLNNRKSCSQATDTFRHCKFTDNFKVSTVNDNLFFNLCHFDYSDGLDRDQVLEVLEGSGSITSINSTVSICRTGSSCAKSFTHLGGNSSTQPCGKISLFKNNIYNVSVEGTRTFMVHHIEGIQEVQFEELHVDVPRSTAKTYIFGSLKKQNNITMSVHCSALNGSGSNVSMLANLWPKLETTQPIVLHGNKLKNMRAMLYGMTDCDGWPDCPKKFQCYSNSHARDGCEEKRSCKSKCCCKQPDTSNCPVPNPNTTEHHIMWSHNQITTSDSHTFRIRYQNTDEQMRLGLVGTYTYNPTTNATPVVFLDQDPLLDLISPVFKIHAAFNSFRNLSQIKPPWLTSGITNTEVAHNSTTITNYGVSLAISPCLAVVFVFLDVVL